MHLIVFINKIELLHLYYIYHNHNIIIEHVALFMFMIMDVMTYKFLICSISL